MTSMDALIEKFGLEAKAVKNRQGYQAVERKSQPCSFIIH